MSIIMADSDQLNLVVLVEVLGEIKTNIATRKSGQICPKLDGSFPQALSNNERLYV